MAPVDTRMLQKSTIQLLRFPFSLFLAPVYFFALSQAPQVDWPRAAWIFFILHVLVYPASNGYNSYMDRDESAIGGLERPMQPTRQLFQVSMIMDLLAVGASLLISPFFCTCIIAYILASRAYSWRGIRLKKYPIPGCLTVILCQGGLTFYMVYTGCHPAEGHPSHPPLLPLAAACLLIGGFYPLTQVYQHEADRRDGVRTISMLLGIRGSFIFCAIVYSLAMGLLAVHFYTGRQMRDFFILTTLSMPVLVYFFNWAGKTWKRETEASFNNTMRMNVVASICTSLAFLFLVILKQIE
jgi:1,4-dihydroxy-2-naphthoate octaprenyltransferase